MSRNLLVLLIISFLGLTTVVLNESSRILEWTLLDFTQQLTYVPVFLLWLVSLIFIVIGFIQRKQQKR